MLAAIAVLPVAAHAQNCGPAPCLPAEQGPTVVVSSGPVSTAPEPNALLTRVSSPNTVALTATTSGGVVLGLALTFISIRRRRLLSGQVREASASPIPVAASHPQWSAEDAHERPSPVGTTYA
jgi:hypothetical protein